MNKNINQKPIPSRQSAAMIILLGIFAGYFIIGSVGILVFKFLEGTLEGEDLSPLGFCFALGMFFATATFMSIRTNIRLKNGYYHENVVKNYHYKGEGSDDL